jgi:predicted dehydrogenase
MPTERRMAAWIAPEQVALVREVAGAAELSLTAAGSPARGHTQSVASALGAAAIDDLRAMLASVEAELVLIGAPGSFGASAPGADAEAVLAAHARGTRIATLEPIPASALDLGAWLSQGVGIRPADALRFVPLLQHAAPFRQAEEVLRHFGHIRTAVIDSWSLPHEGTLGARLFGALALAQALLGEPESIDAAYASPAQGSGIHPLPGETLRGLAGDITACLRFADGRIASVTCSDQGGRWNRAATLAGPAGRLRIFDDGFEWIGPGGDKLDELRPRRAGGRGAAQPAHAVEALADSLSRLLDPGNLDATPLDHATIMAMAQATLLSARTGEPESPSTIKHMVGAA